MTQKRMECFELLLEHLAWIDHEFLSGIRDSRKAGSLWGMIWDVGGVRKSIQQSWLYVVITAGRWSSWSIQIPQFLMLWWSAMKARSTAMTQRPRDRVPSGSMLSFLDPRRPDRANLPTNFWLSLFWQHWHDLHAPGSHWRDSQQGILCWGFKGVQEEIPWEEASTLQIGSVAFPPGQCTSPQLHPCHRLFPEVVGTVQQVHCSRRRLLQRGLDFHVCTINKGAHTKKVWKLILWALYIYIYIW